MTGNACLGVIKWLLVTFTSEAKNGLNGLLASQFPPRGARWTASAGHHASVTTPEKKALRYSSGWRRFNYQHLEHWQLPATAQSSLHSANTSSTSYTTTWGGEIKVGQSWPGHSRYYRVLCGFYRQGLTGRKSLTTPSSGRSCWRCWGRLSARQVSSPSSFIRDFISGTLVCINIRVGLGTVSLVRLDWCQPGLWNRS